MFGERRLGITPAIRTLVANSEATYKLTPYDPNGWKQAARELFMMPGDEELHGGHRNLVKRISGSNEVNIYWRHSDWRWEEIMRGILLEDAMARYYGIPGRALIDPKLPVELHDDGVLMTRVWYIDGEDRYPYSSLEIASAARMLGKLHQGLRQISFEGERAAGGNQWLHRDYARANVLFKPGSADVAAVIDYENAAIGSVTEDVGAFLRFLLVDARIDGISPQNLDQAVPVFEQITRVLFENYPVDKRHKQDFQVNSAIHAAGYLLNQDYGDLNKVRDLALVWLRHKYNLR